VLEGQDGSDDSSLELEDMFIVARVGGATLEKGWLGHGEKPSKRGAFNRDEGKTGLSLLPSFLCAIFSGLSKPAVMGGVYISKRGTARFVQRRSATSEGNDERRARRCVYQRHVCGDGGHACSRVSWPWLEFKTLELVRMSSQRKTRGTHLLEGALGTGQNKE